MRRSPRKKRLLRKRIAANPFISFPRWEEPSKSSSHFLFFPPADPLFVFLLHLQNSAPVERSGPPMKMTKVTASFRPNPPRFFSRSTAKIPTFHHMNDPLEVAVSAAREAGGPAPAAFRRHSRREGNACPRHQDRSRHPDAGSDHAAAARRLSRNMRSTARRGIAGNQASEWQWIVDPIDGTVNYFYGASPHFCVSIALRRGTEMQLRRLIYDPMRDELWHGRTRRYCRR